MSAKSLSTSVIAVMVLAIFGQSSEARELTKDEKSTIAAAVQARLKDPGAAKFTWPPVVNEEYYCGIVNGKNSYGGYVGDSPFIVGLSKRSKGKLSPTSLDVGRPSDDSGTTAEILRVCREAGYTLDIDGGLPSALAQRSILKAQEKGS